MTVRPSPKRWRATLSQRERVEYPRDRKGRSIFGIGRETGRNISDATKEGVYYIEVGEKEFRWKLPLGSLLPPKICPVCKEKLSGAYKYCPWDGTKLPETAK
jgi:hypothetical protein